MIPIIGAEVLGLQELPVRSTTVEAVADIDDGVVSGLHRGVIRHALKILLVEDDPGDAMLIRIALSEQLGADMALSSSETLAGARTLAAQGGFDVALLDLSLPDSSGLKTLTRLQEVAPTLPIVVMTGLDDPRFADSALEAGAQDYLVKGTDPGPGVVRAIRYAITRMHAEVERRVLIESLTAERNQMQAELTAARAMQFDLLPRGSRISGQLAGLGLRISHYFQPSSAIGGDMWGCVEAGPSRMTVFAYDFAGHGVSAALNVFRLHTVLGHHPDLFANPAALLAQVNATLLPLLPKGQFATMFAGCIDTAENSLTWAAAGAPRPVLLLPDRIEMLETRGLPLGLSLDASYATHRIEFPVGAGLFVYSDAMTEALDLAGRPMGEARIALNLGLAMSQGEAALTVMLDRFFETAQLPIEDDLTAVWITRQAPAGQAGLSTEG